jgi:hypothetical protein
MNPIVNERCCVFFREVKIKLGTHVKMLGTNDLAVFGYLVTRYNRHFFEGGRKIRKKSNISCGLSMISTS